MTSIREKQLFRSCYPNLGDAMHMSKMAALQHMWESGLEATLLVDPVDNFALGRGPRMGLAHRSRVRLPAKNLLTTQPLRGVYRAPGTRRESLAFRGTRALYPKPSERIPAKKSSHWQVPVMWQNE